MTVMQAGKTKMLEDEAFKYLQDNPDGKVKIASATGFDRTIKNVKEVKSCSNCQTFLDFGHEISPSECDNCGPTNRIYWSPQEQKQTKKLAMIGIRRKGERKFTIKVAG